MVEKHSANIDVSCESKNFIKDKTIHYELFLLWIGRLANWESNCINEDEFQDNIFDQKGSKSHESIPNQYDSGIEFNRNSSERSKHIK